MPPANPSDSEMTVVDWILAIVCSTIGCIVGIVYLVQGKPKATKMIIISIIAEIVKSGIYFAVQMASQRGN